MRRPRPYDRIRLVRDDSRKHSTIDKFHGRRVRSCVVGKRLRDLLDPATGSLERCPEAFRDEEAVG